MYVLAALMGEVWNVLSFSSTRSHEIMGHSLLRVGIKRGTGMRNRSAEPEYGTGMRNTEPECGIRNAEPEYGIGDKTRNWG